MRSGLCSDWDSNLGAWNHLQILFPRSRNICDLKDRPLWSLQSRWS
jgi:hypothetical protein